MINRKTSQLGITYYGGPLAPETESGITTLRPTTFLIRPDGYVGAVAATGDANTVLDMFRRLPN